MDSTNNIECTPQEVAEMLNGENTPRLIDVREPAEWEIVHLEGGKLLTQELIEDILNSWEKDASIVCYCHHGIRSMQAALFLRQQGFSNVRSMQGGIDAWAKDVDPNIDRY
jgi:rhodanese-related sulfurtransferase